MWYSDILTFFIWNVNVHSEEENYATATVISLQTKKKLQGFYGTKKLHYKTCLHTHIF